MTAKKTLIIVESPAKAKTIEKYLGSGYKVTASMGHLIDLPKSRLAIDIDNHFQPEYITVRGKAKILKEIVSLAKKSDEILLASDNDREGEAIAWHLRSALNEKSQKPLAIKRIVFNEITPNAIKAAVENPIDVDESKVAAQKGRRVLDRLVGYNLSPLLWKKVKNGLSAGRVQSVALRLICEREKEVEEFIPEEYWTLDVELIKGKTIFEAKLISWEGEKIEFSNKAALDQVLSKLEGEPFEVVDVKSSSKKSNPRPPFITSTLQQTAANRIGFTSRKTMQIAQQLYEGISIGENRVGLITYMRTDSTRISDDAIKEAREWIAKDYPSFLPDQPQIYQAKKGAQDAHEAIRPTYIIYTPDYVKPYLTNDQYKIYTLIWERFVSSQMTPSLTEITSYDIACQQAVFRATSSVLKEKGFQSVLKLLKSGETVKKIPSLKREEKIEKNQWLTEQHFTSGPARYTDASIVKALEEFGIGRPSTYAPIISVLLDRYYVVRKNKQLMPTVLGRTISNLLVQYFSDYIDVEFTAGLEKTLDEVEEGSADWVGMIEEFWKPFIQQIENVNEKMESIKGVLDEPTDQICPDCGKSLVKKLGRFGFFLACTGFPECYHTESIPLCDCPKEGCNGKIVARKKQGSRGKEFYGCTNYPECDFISYYKPTNQKCPSCGELLVEKSDKKRGDYKACINPECSYLHSPSEEEPLVEKSEDVEKE